MAHQYSRVGFNSSVEVNEVNLSLSFGGVGSVYAQSGKRTLIITSLDWIHGLCAEVRVKQLFCTNTWVKFQAIILNGINQNLRF